jgi:diacylglycerol kinase
MRKIFISISHAWDGVIQLFKEEPHARIEMVVGILFIALGFWFGLAAWEWCFVIGCIGLVIAAEAVNTSIEQICNFQTKEWREEIRIIKDMASGAVLIVGMMSILVGVIIFGPKLYLLFF